MSWLSMLDPGASGDAKGLTCADARASLVALQADELPLIEAEAVRAHLARCDDCREEALEMELAARSVRKLPAAEKLEPPEGLVERTMRRVLEAHGWKDEAERILQTGALPALAPVPGAARAVARARRRAAKVLRALFSPVRHPAVKAAAIVLLLATLVVLAVHDVAEAVGNFQMSLLGERVSQALARAGDRFLDCFGRF